MNRRGFLGAMLAAASAPTIVKAENLMKIIVPPEKKLIVGRGLTQSMQILDESPFAGYIDEVRITRGIPSPTFMRKLRNNSISGARVPADWAERDRMLQNGQVFRGRYEGKFVEPTQPFPDKIDWDKVSGKPKEFPFQAHPHDPYWTNVQLLIRA